MGDEFQDGLIGNLKLPPQDLNAEKAVLGALLLNSDRFGNVADILSEEDFYSVPNSIIYKAAYKLFADGSPVDAITVVDQLTKSNELEKVGGTDAIFDISASVPSAANVEYYARIVKDKAILRQMINIGIHIEDLGYQTESEEVKTAINIAQEEVFELTEGASSQDYQSIGESMPSVIDMIKQSADNGEIDGVPTGFRRLDQNFAGLKGGQVIVIAARPGVGKSTLSNDIARCAAIHNNIPTVIFNLEMSYHEIVKRFISAELSIDANALKTGRLKPEEWEKITAFQKKMTGETTGKPVPLYIDDSANLNMMQIRTKCRRLKAAGNLGLVIVDYLQLMTSGERVESRQQEVSSISRRLKLLAKELDVPVIAISQLNRQSEGIAGVKKREPQLSDLRESGSIEQDADIVVFIHREDMGVDEEELLNDEDGKKYHAGEAKIIIAKNRAGNMDGFWVAALLHWCRFQDAGVEF
ncbi:MAG: replicative DNA helicase [Candidatus Ancillula sp.]|jgi:replicative DNA helicase|nr:replicative DNA helicase [Candidatus Ancillula sp.]